MHRHFYSGIPHKVGLALNAQTTLYHNVHNELKRHKKKRTSLCGVIYEQNDDGGDDDDDDTVEFVLHMSVREVSENLELCMAALMYVAWIMAAISRGTLLEALGRVQDDEEEEGDVVLVGLDDDTDWKWVWRVAEELRRSFRFRGFLRRSFLVEPVASDWPVSTVVVEGEEMKEAFTAYSWELCVEIYRHTQKQKNKQTLQ